MLSRTRRTGPGSATRGRCVPLVLALAAGMAGCSKKADTRISVQQLAERQQLAQTTATLNVEPARLNLDAAEPFRLHPGDVLSLRLTGLAVERYAETLLQVRVHDDGQIFLPVVGGIPAAGRTLTELERAIIDAHVPRVVKDMAVFIELVQPDNTTVLVLGAALAPGLVKLRANERNVLFALAASGGFNTTTSGRLTLRPIRPERPEVTYDLSNANDVRRALTAPPLESGDTVVVEAGNNSAVYTVGLVNAPGPILIPPHSRLSVLRAIAASGGLADFLDPEDATIWRQLPNGEQVRVAVNLTALLDGEAEDIELQPGDVLDIPHTARTRVRQWAAQNIRLGPFGVTAVYDPVADYRARILRDDNDDNNFQAALFQSLGRGISEIVVPPVEAP